MPRIGNWEKENDHTWSQVVTKPWQTPYQNPRKKIWVMISEAPPFARAKGKWTVLLHHVSGYTESHYFKTKEEAGIFAKDWMKKFPHGDIPKVQTRKRKS